MVVVSVDVAVVVAVAEEVVVVVVTPGVPPQVHPLWLWQLVCVDMLPHSAAVPSHTGASCHVHPGASRQALLSLLNALQETLCPPIVVVPVHVVCVFQVHPIWPWQYVWLRPAHCVAVPTQPEGEVESIGRLTHLHPLADLHELSLVNEPQR